jgi:hypothetical protein
MRRKVLISLAIAFLAAVLTYLAIVVLAPDMYVEKAFNLLAAAFIGTAGLTSLVLIRRRR